MITNNANNFVNLAIPVAGNYSPGTVVEFDIIAATGSTWQMITVDETGSTAVGFIQQQRPGNDGAPSNANDYQDFNTFWNNNPANPVFSNQINSFPQLVGGSNFSGSAFVRLIALRLFASQQDTTTVSGSSHWFGRIIERGF
jgi:hypothetical protein